MINFSNYFQQRKLFNNLSFTEKVKYVNNPENKLSKPLVLLGFVEEKAGHLFLLFPLIFFVFLILLNNLLLIFQNILNIQIDINLILQVLGQILTILLLFVPLFIMFFNALIKELKINFINCFKNQLNMGILLIIAKHINSLSDNEIKLLNNLYKSNDIYALYKLKESDFKTLEPMFTQIKTNQIKAKKIFNLNKQLGLISSYIDYGNFNDSHIQQAILNLEIYYENIKEINEYLMRFNYFNQSNESKHIVIESNYSTPKDKIEEIIYNTIQKHIINPIFLNDSRDSLEFDKDIDLLRSEINNWISTYDILD